MLERLRRPILVISCLVSCNIGLVAYLPLLLEASDQQLSWAGQNVLDLPPSPHSRAHDGLPLLSPTHTACEGFDGIYHIHIADIEGGVGTALFQLVIGQILYAEENNLKPWIHFGNLSRVVYDPVVHGSGDGVDFKSMVGREATIVRGLHPRDQTPGPPNPLQPVTQKSLHFPGTGIWNHYFEPVSDFVPGDTSCESKLYVTMSLYLVIPGLHGFSPNKSTRAWRYDYLPDYVSQPHVPLTEWLAPQREKAHEVVSKYFFLRRHLQSRVHAVNPDCSLENSCLGVHIRHSDKAAGRIVIPTSAFLPYIKAFIEAGGKHIYLATDSQAVIREIHQDWPHTIVEKLRTLSSAVRSNNTDAVFDLSGHHRTNEEVLVEIYSLAKCQFLVHSLSAVSEAAIWVNLDLHKQSVNLEDPDHIHAAAFGALVQLVLGGVTKALPGPPVTDRWWSRPKLASTHHISCPTSSDVLLIHEVGEEETVMGALFTSVLNQLLFAEKNNLVPWIHIGKRSSPLVYESGIHDDGPMGTENITVESITSIDGMTASSTMTETVAIEGSGVWPTYFLPVHSFRFESCKGIRVYSLTKESVSQIRCSTREAIRAWRYDEVPADVWNSAGSAYHELYEPMRTQASMLVRKYFHFQQYLLTQANKVNPISETERCLAIHLRTGDKRGRFRRRVKATEILSYVNAFLATGGRVVYLATDSHRTLRYIYNSFPADVLTTIRTQGKFVVRTSKVMPLHLIDDHHRINSEALVDALAMSKCSAILHGHSTLSETAIYLNPKLSAASVNMEEPSRLTPEEFLGVLASPE